MNKRDFEKSYHLTKTALLWSGIDVYNWDRQLILKFLFVFNFIWVYSDALGEVYWVLTRVMARESVEELSVILPCVAICLLSLARITPLFLNKDSVVRVIDKLAEMYPYQEDNRDKEEETEDNIEITKIRINANKAFYKVLYFMVTANISVIFAFCGTPLLLMAVEYQKSGLIELKLPFYVKYFFDPLTYAAWPFVYLHHIGSTLIVVTNMFGADTFFHGFCIYLRMYFEMLCQDIQNLITASKDETQNRLRRCVLRHQELIALVDQMEALYSKSFIFNFIMSSVLICLGGFNIVSSEQFGPIFSYSNYLIMCLYQIFLLCFYGDSVVTSSSQVSDAVFNSKWYDADIAIRKSLHIILLRSQKPCSLTAAKFATINLTAFSTILGRSWSYFALLRTMYD